MDLKLEQVKTLGQKELAEFQAIKARYEAAKPQFNQVFEYQAFWKEASNKLSELDNALAILKEWRDDKERIYNFLNPLCVAVFSRATELEEELTEIRRFMRQVLEEKEEALRLTAKMRQNPRGVVTEVPDRYTGLS